jgi:hypothetical protein
MRARNLVELLAVNAALRQQEEQTALLRDSHRMQEAAFAEDHPDLYEELQRQRLEQKEEASVGGILIITVLLMLGSAVLLGSCFFAVGRMLPDRPPEHEPTVCGPCPVK